MTDWFDEYLKEQQMRQETSKQLEHLRWEMTASNQENKRLREALKECARPFKGTLPDWESAARALTDEFQRRVNVAISALKQQNVSQMTHSHTGHAKMSDDKGQL